MSKGVIVCQLMLLNVNTYANVGGKDEQPFLLYDRTEGMMLNLILYVTCQNKCQLMF